MSRILLLGALLAIVAMAAEREQLPADVVPVRYDLALVPDAVNLTFRGRVQIGVDVKVATQAIVLNADELVFDKAFLDKEDAPAVVTLDTKLQRAALKFAHPVATGAHTITIDYHGVIGRSTLGFFAMDYDSPAGKRRTIATNFEPASERRFMPSWDEPGLKATFTISVEVPADRMAVGNMPIESTENLANGAKRVHFATSPKMSTYLLYLGIGDFERVTTKSDGVDVGVVVNSGDAEKGRYALGEAAKLLHFYNDYFGVAYPLPKLDLIVAPGSIDGSSMENWGAIFYSQRDLLFNPKTSTEADRQRVFQVVAHEMAHQWFGDLVTMAWWDNLWLNEGFARWMQTKAADGLHPEWKTGLQALAITESGKRSDAKPSTHPVVQPVLTAAQAEQAFDNITYNKGSGVIGMLEGYVGATAFRDGIRRYMHAHAYGNSVDADFWREVQAVAGKPVLDVEGDFTQQPGVPLLRVESEQSSGGSVKVTLKQGRFAEDPATIASARPESWRTPVTLSAGGASKTQLVSGSAPTTIQVPGAGPVIVNAGQTTYARTLYPQAMIPALGARIATAKAEDQLGLLYDAWALGQSGYEPVTNYLDLARAIPGDADPVVWRQIVGTLVSIDNLYEGNPGRAAFVTFAGGVLRPLADRLGWDAQQNEDPNTSTMRSLTLVALSRFGDLAVVAEARRRFDISQRDPQGFPPAVRRTALTIVARNADAVVLDRLLGMLRASHDPLEKQVLMTALEGVADPAGAQRILELAIGPDAIAGTASGMLTAVSAAHPDMAWNFAMQHADRLGALMTSSERTRTMPEIAANSSDPQRGQDLRAYAEKNIPAETRQGVESAIATIGLNAKFRAERLPQIDRWLASRKPR